MDRRTFLTASFIALTAQLLEQPQPAYAAGQVVVLPAPDKKGGLPLMQCLQKRQTNRHLGNEDLTLPEISNLLWAAYGVNRSDGRHVIPTARNQQKVMLFAALGDGVWKYLADKNSIEKVLDGDRRSAFDGSSMILLFAAPTSDMFGGMHVGSMYQNVALYCASQDYPNCVKHTNCNALDKYLPLPSGWKVLISQSIGSKVK